MGSRYSLVANSIVSSVTSGRAKAVVSGGAPGRLHLSATGSPNARPDDAIAAARRHEQERRSRRTAKARVLSLRERRSLPNVQGECRTEHEVDARGQSA